MAYQISFEPQCPLCGRTDHKRYLYKGKEVFACPEAPKDKILVFDFLTNDLIEVIKEDWDRKRVEELLDEVEE